MDEALGWLDGVPPVERKLIGLVLGRLASGYSQVPWGELLAPMGVVMGAHGLRRRYERALGALCRAVNRRTCAAPLRSSPEIGGGGDF